MRRRWTFGRRWGALLGGAILALCVCAPAGAQTTTGNIRGVVKNPSGAPVTGATITARELGTNLQRGALTSSSGVYYLAGLRPGRWAVSAQMLGFATRSDTVQLLVGQTLELDITLSEQAVELGALVVTAPAAQETRSSEVAANVTRQQIADLPTRDRNFLDLAQLAPGVRIDFSQEDKSFTAGALPANNVNVFIDGASYKNDVIDGGVAGQNSSKGNPFPQGAVQEFRVITQNYKAEYQMASSAIITAVTRSGTNNWEGSLYGYNICRGCVAKDAFAASRGLAAPDFRRMQLGGSFGGPIRRDKLFFFGTYEFNNRVSPEYVIPGDTSLVPGSSQYAGRFSDEFQEHLGFAKLTFTPASRHTIDISANLRHESDLAGFGGQTAYTAREDKIQNVITTAANWKYVANNWLNEAQLSFQNYDWHPRPASATGADLLQRQYFGVITIGPKESSQEWTQRRFSLRDAVSPNTMSWAGEHAFKFGANVDFLHYATTKNFFNLTPSLAFDPNISTTVPLWAVVGVGNPSIATSDVQFGAFAQDDWTVSPRLILNLGIRWDAETNAFDNSFVAPQSVRDSIRAFYNAGALLNQNINAVGGIDQFLSGSKRKMYLGAFQPRFGFSYDLTGNNRTVLAGGIGIFYDRDIYNQMIDERFRRQYSWGNVCFAGSAPSWCQPQIVAWSPALANADTLRALGRLTPYQVFLISHNPKPPHSTQWNIGIHQALGHSILGTLSYVGNRGYNGFSYVWGGHGLGPSYTDLLLSTSTTNSFYDAVVAQLNKPMLATSRWGGSIAYTLGWAKQQGEYFFSLDNRYNWPAAYPKWPVKGDQRHQIVANGIYRAPYDFLVSGILYLGSGVADWATDNSQQVANNPQSSHTYAFYPPKRTFLGIPNAFATQRFDMRVQKSVRLPNTQSVGLVLDLFNAFNSPNYACYNGYIPPPTASPNTDFGKPGCAGEGRRVQFGLQYGFNSGRTGE